MNKYDKEDTAGGFGCLGFALTILGAIGIILGIVAIVFIIYVLNTD